MCPARVACTWWKPLESSFELSPLSATVRSSVPSRVSTSTVYTSSRQVTTRLSSASPLIPQYCRSVATLENVFWSMSTKRIPFPSVVTATWPSDRAHSRRDLLLSLMTLLQLLLLSVGYELQLATIRLDARQTRAEYTVVGHGDTARII
ncbi:hypothetical protein C0Q70_10976 [Pomacea canaliculata]|uniref:Uncharacterized protein n=1 Tax=Pomacea canaliculata TaxID=400727 RepID=A0A2T7P4P0_POMCA|nr:hypothetical protein C0Q70_10976 [Pomacea canaliculata]